MNKNTTYALSLCFDKSPEEAIEILKSKGIKITWNWKEQLQAIRENAFTVAKVSSADILQTINDEIIRAAENGTPLAEFKKNLMPILEDKGYAKKEDKKPWRLETIYRTNLQSAFMAGRFKQMSEVKNYFPYWEFIIVSDNRTTDGCKSLTGIVLRADDNFWTTNYPPRHYNCRSRVRAISEFQMKKRGLKLTDADSVKNIEPAKGFETYPGEWLPDLNKYSPNLKRELSTKLNK